MSGKTTYSNVAVKDLKWNEAIRLRPGMYIGKTDINGFVELLKGALSNILTYAGKNNKCIIKLVKNRQARVEIINLNQRIENQWEIWDRNPKNISHIGMETINALSKRFEISFLDENQQQIAIQKFQEGRFIEGNRLDSIDCNELVFDFDLDVDIWGEQFIWNELYVSKQLQEFAYLYKNTWFEIIYQIKSENCRVIYSFNEGLKDRILLEELTGLGGSYFQTYIDKQFDGFSLEAALAFREYTVDEPYIRSFVNDRYTHEEGTHVDAVLKGLTYGVMQYFQHHELTNKYKISEKGMREHLICFLNIRLNTPIYSGCVRNKLANPEIIEPISNFIAEVLHQKLEKGQELTDRLIRKFEM